MANSTLGNKRDKSTKAFNTHLMKKYETENENHPMRKLKTLSRLEHSSHFFVPLKCSIQHAIHTQMGEGGVF